MRRPLSCPWCPPKPRNAESPYRDSPTRHRLRCARVPHTRMCARVIGSRAQDLQTGTREKPAGSVAFRRLDAHASRVGILYIEREEVRANFFFYINNRESIQSSSKSSYARPAERVSRTSLSFLCARSIYTRAHARDARQVNDTQKSLATARSRLGVVHSFGSDNKMKLTFFHFFSSNY